ncbi:response regulator [Patescibacteria group bacterium]|nr:response regulator [Patescibacteria group bacterium]
MTKNTKKKPTILLIEDHPDIVAMYRVAFETKLKDTLQVAMDKEEGLEKIHEIKPDLVLLDLIIPEAKGEGVKPISRHGFELLKELRKNPETKKTKVIVLTNIESTQDRKEAKRLGTLEYVVKSHTLPHEVVELTITHIEKE